MVRNVFSIYFDNKNKVVRMPTVMLCCTTLFLDKTTAFRLLHFAWERNLSFRGTSPSRAYRINTGCVGWIGGRKRENSC